MRRLIPALALLWFLGLPALPAAAQDAPPTPEATAATETAPPGFERVTGPAAAQASVQAPPLVVAAYLFIWACTLAYVVVLWRRQRQLTSELEGLERRLRAVE